MRLFINAGALKSMRKLLHNSRPKIVEYAAWTISNIVAGNTNQIQKVVDESLLNDIVHLLKSGEIRSQKVATWVIASVTSKGSDEQIIYLINEINVFEPLCDLLSSEDTRLIVVILSILKNLFAFADKKGCLDQSCMVNIFCE